VALAVAAHHPSLVCKLSLTAVPLERPALGRVILDSWMESLAGKSCITIIDTIIHNNFTNDA
jgi:hypothetical protein